MAKSRKSKAKQGIPVTKKVSTQELTGGLHLVDIPNLSLGDQTCWKIKALARLNSEGREQSQVLKALEHWNAKEREDFKRILKSLKYVGANQIHADRTKVEADRKKRGVFEIRANRCRCRLMFFYDNEVDCIVVCTNTYWKGKGAHDKDQDQAFAQCARLKKIYFENKEKPS